MYMRNAMQCEPSGTWFYSVKCSIYNGNHKQILLHVNYETFSYRRIWVKLKFQEKRQTKNEKRDKFVWKKTHANEK